MSKKIILNGDCYVDSVRRKAGETVETDDATADAFISAGAASEAKAKAEPQPENKPAK
jgi:hypothetical protein